MSNRPPPKGMTRAESKARNRRALLDATRDILLERGYAGLSASAVSSRAGVGQSSFYAHFKDKDDLVRTFASEILDRLRTLLREGRDEVAAVGWEAILHGTWLRMFAFFNQERELIALLFQEMEQPGSPVREIGQAIFDTLHKDFDRDLRNLVKSGLLPPLPVEALTTLIIGTSTYVLRRVLAGRIKDPVALLTQMDRLNHALIAGLAAEAAASPPKKRKL